jgi:hypothetical protein
VGLARVRAEGQMRLTLSCEEDRVCLRAEADLTMIPKPVVVNDRSAASPRPRR